MEGSNHLRDLVEPQLLRESESGLRFQLVTARPLEERDDRHGLQAPLVEV